LPVRHPLAVYEHDSNTYSALVRKVSEVLEHAAIFREIVIERRKPGAIETADFPFAHSSSSSAKVVTESAPLDATEPNRCGHRVDGMASFLARPSDDGRMVDSLSSTSTSVSLAARISLCGASQTRSAETSSMRGILAAVA
jgi:hypothetical protein